MAGFTLDDDERADLLAFLHARTDSEFLSDPRFSDPDPNADVGTAAGGRAL